MGASNISDLKTDIAELVELANEIEKTRVRELIGMARLLANLFPKEKTPCQVIHFPSSRSPLP